MNRFKISILLITTVLAVTGMFYYQVSTAFSDVFVKLQQDNTRRASKLLLQSAESEISNKRDQVLALARIESARKWTEAPQTKAVLSEDLKQSAFLGISFIQKQNGQWNPRWVALQNQVIENWSEYLISKTQQAIKFKQLKPGTVWFEKTLNHQKRPVWLMAFLVDFEAGSSQSQGALVAILSNEALAKMGLAFRGFDYDFILMNEKGFAVNHSTTGYISASFSEYSIFSEKNPFQKNEFFESFFLVGEKEYWGVHQQVPKSNLRLVVSQNVKSFKAAPIVFETKWLIGIFGILLLALSVGFLLKNEIEEKFVLLKTAVFNFSDGVADVPDDWRKRIPNSITALEKLFEKSKGVDTENSQIIKLANQIIEDRNKDGGADEEASGEEPSSEDTPIQSRMELTTVGSLMPAPPPEPTPTPEPDLDSTLDPASMIAGPNEVDGESGDLSGLSGIDSDIATGDLDSQDLTTADVEVLEEISRLEDAPPGGFWLQKVVADVLRELKPRMKKMDLRMLLSNQHRRPIPIAGDPKHLLTALKHIVSNSLEAMEDAPEKILQIQMNLHGDEARVDVTDVGSGISDTAIEKAFDPFYTEKESVDHPGLGLTAAKKSIGSLGGYIDLKSVEDGGCQASIIVPLAGHKLVGLEPTEDEPDEEDEFQMVPSHGLGDFQPVDDDSMPDAPPLPPDSDSAVITPPAPKQPLVAEAPITDKSPQEQAKDLLDDMVNMQVKVRSPKVK